MIRSLAFGISLTIGGAALTIASVSAAQGTTTPQRRPDPNQAPVNLSGTWVPDGPYGTVIVIVQKDTTIVITRSGTTSTYNLDGSDSTNGEHTDSVFWRDKTLVVVRDNQNAMRAEYEMLGARLKLTVGGKYILLDKK